MVASAPSRELIVGDNLTVLEELEPACIDLVYVDPPFATGKRKGKALGYEDPGELGAYVEKLMQRMRLIRRALVPTGSLFVHLDWRAVHHVKVALDGLFGAQRFVNEIIWAYSVGGKSRRAFGRKHDTILWYAAGPDYYFDGDAVRVPRRSGSHMKVELDADGRPVQVKRDRKTAKVYRYPVHAGKVPDDTWTDIETLNREDRQRTGWPTQKPLALLERIVRAASPPGGLVADFYCGSGTTLVAAKCHGRRFLGVDLSQEAVAIARERLAKTGVA